VKLRREEMPPRGVVVAAIKLPEKTKDLALSKEKEFDNITLLEDIARKLGKKESRLPDVTASLQALTAASLILPGIMQSTARAADDDSVDFQYSHYQEGKRDIYGLVGDDFGHYYSTDGTFQEISDVTKLASKFKPIEVDSLHGSSRVTLTDRIKFSFNYLQDTWSGATPVATAPAVVGGNRLYRFTDPQNIIHTGSGASPLIYDVAPLYFDNKLNNRRSIYSATSGEYTPGAINNRLTHVLSSASPETRKQGDFKLSYEWDEAAVDVGGGISTENDYESRFVNLGGRMDFNQKRTTANLGLSYTNSDTFAKIDPDTIPFMDVTGYESEIGEPYTYEDGGVIYEAIGVKQGAILRGNRQDWGTQLGLTQVLSKNGLLELGMGYTRSTGFLSNPYKLIFDWFAYKNPGQDLYFSNEVYARIEKRPDERNQFNWNLGYNQFIEPLDAALHFDYHFAHDDWGINAHTFEADWVQPLGAGWTVTPRIRYYSQSRADFYWPYFVELFTVGADGETTQTQFMPKHYSSDQRLSGFGALSGGITVSKQFAKGVGLEAGFEYYSHQGGLKLGGGGEQDFADFDYWVANAALKVDLAAVGTGLSSHPQSHRHHASHGTLPAGLMFAHTLDKSGDFMVGYRFQRSEQAGNMLLGSEPVGANTVLNQGCGNQECLVTPNFMAMSMHMLDLMYAPTDWLSLMLMPQWMDMEMKMTQLKEHHFYSGIVHNEQTGGIGDLGLYALFKLFDQPHHHLTLSLGGTAPTGAVDLIQRNVISLRAKLPVHYGMQLGSGTWDFKPALTYTGNLEAFSWGAQANGTIRLEENNDSGYRLGDNFQGSVWGGYGWNGWLSTTVRGIYTWQDKNHGAYPSIKNEYGDPFVNDHLSTVDIPGNYGGQFVDLGLGINVTIPSGAFQGNTLKFEWLQPIQTDYNGYQLDRDYALNFTWSYGF
jgi:hypothetical protein